MRRRLHRGVGSALVALAAAGAVWLVPTAAAPSPPATTTTLEGTVSEVVDGDTIKVVSRGFETPVRLMGIDTPETRHPTKPVECYGPAASAMTARLLPVGRRVRLVSDPTQDLRDRYARLLAYVYTAGRSGAEGSVNFTLVRTGRARVYVYGGVAFRYADAFFRAQNRARRARSGLWGPPCNGDTTKPDPSAPARGGCDPNYAGACIPVYPPDVDCRDIPDRNFRVVGTDVHHFDVDHDGIACEQ